MSGRHKGLRVAPAVAGTTRRPNGHQNIASAENPGSRVLRTVEELSQLRGQLEGTTPVGFTITRSAGGLEQHIVYASPGFSSLTGYELAEVVHRDCRLLQRGDRNQPGRAQLREAIAARRETTALLRNYRKNGEMFWNEVFISPLYGTSDADNLFLGVQHDVTVRQHSVELLGKNADLPEILAKTLTDQDRYKHEFLNVVSHELRNPVQAILGFTELLGDTISTHVDPLLQECLAGLHHETLRLHCMVDNLLLTSQMVTGTLVISPAPTDYAALLMERIAAIAPAAKRKGIRIRTHLKLPREVAVDGAAIQKVLSNLLDNAVKFAPSHAGTVYIHARLVHGVLITRIRNPIPPVASSFSTHLFQPFVQGDMSIRRVSGGLGLGLCVSKTLIEGHGGTLKLARTPQNECVTTFQIPIPPKVRPMTLRAG